MAGLGLNVGADFAAELGGKLDHLAQVGKTQLQIGWRKYHALSGGITGIGSQTVATTIPGPEAGRLWHIHRLSFGTVTPAGAITTAGTIVIGKGTGVQTQAQSSGQIIAGAASQFIEVERSTTVGQFTWGRAQFVLVYPMNLIVFWASGTDKLALSIDGDAYEYLAETAQPSPG